MRIHIANSRPKTNARFCTSPPRTTTASPSTRCPPPPKLAPRKNPLLGLRRGPRARFSAPNHHRLPYQDQVQGRRERARRLPSSPAQHPKPPRRSAAPSPRSSAVFRLSFFTQHARRIPLPAPRRQHHPGRYPHPLSPSPTRLARSPPLSRTNCSQGALTLFPHRHWSFNSELWLSLPRPYPAQLNRSIAVANATSRSVMRLPASCVFSRSTTRLYTF
jgi:hypothetical protein